MTKRDKFIERLMSGKSDANIDFAQLSELLRSLGFVEETEGSHHNFRKPGVREKINLQASGRHAKPYQVKQVRDILKQLQESEQ